MSRRIGLDVGGVIIDKLRNDGTDTDLRGENFLRTTAVPFVYEAVGQLVARYGTESVFIISKCGEVIQDRTRKWLDANDFYGRTGFSPENLYFCKTRPQKVPIAQTLGITDFVDDRADVLDRMKDVVARRYLFGPQVDVSRNTEGLIVANNWEEVLALIFLST